MAVGRLTIVGGVREPLNFAVRQQHVGQASVLVGRETLRLGLGPAH